MLLKAIYLERICIESTCFIWSGGGGLDNTRAWKGSAVPSGCCKSLRGDNVSPEGDGNEVGQRETKDNCIIEYALDKMHHYNTSKQRKMKTASLLPVYYYYLPINPLSGKYLLSLLRTFQQLLRTEKFVPSA